MLFSWARRLAICERVCDSDVSSVRTRPEQELVVSAIAPEGWVARPQALRKGKFCVVAVGEPGV